jgi:hypothetical protein
VDSSLTRGSVGPTVFSSSWGCRGHNGRAILIRHRGRRALIQEGPPLVFHASVLSIWHCLFVDAAPASPVSILSLNGGVGEIGVAPI